MSRERSSMFKLGLLLAFLLGAGAQLAFDALVGARSGTAADAGATSASAPAPAPSPPPAPAPAGPRLATSTFGLFEPPPSYVALPDAIDDAWRARVRGGLAELLRPRAGSVNASDAGAPPPALPPAPPPAPPPATLLEERREGDVVMRLYRLAMRDGHAVRAMILEPARAPRTRTLVVALHGHDLEATGLDLLLLDRSYQKGIARHLAARGHTVLAMETRGLGGSPTDDIPHAAYAGRLRLQGRELHGEILGDNRAGLAFALAQATDIERVGVVGASMGGLSALYLSIFEPRIEVALLSGIVGSFRGAFSSISHCPCSLTPGLLERFDMPQLLAASHARLISVEAGTRDPVMGVNNLDPVRAAVESLEARGGPRVEVHVFDGGHEHDVAHVLDVFDRFSAAPRP